MTKNELIDTAKKILVLYEQGNIDQACDLFDAIDPVARQHNLLEDNESFNFWIETQHLIFGHDSNTLEEVKEIFSKMGRA